uniref:Thymopoietin a n=2 Tax=Nothobranchius rachovii TaxID=451742 RepID=A0A1A8S0V0_9TELE
MPEFLEDPSVLTKDKLKSELQAHNVELPGGNPNKDVYVQLYLKNLTAQNKKHDQNHQNSTVDTFSSDEELPWVAISSRSRSSGKKSTRKTEKVQLEELNVSKLTDSDLRDELLKHGVDVGPIVASTRKLYEKKLQHLLADGPGPTPQLPAAVQVNGTTEPDVYSDKEDDETPEPEPEPEPEPVTEPEPEPQLEAAPVVEIALRSRGKTQHQTVEKVAASDQTPKVEEKDVLKELLSYDTNSPAGINVFCRRSIRGAAERPVTSSDLWKDKDHLLSTETSSYSHVVTHSVNSVSSLPPSAPSTSHLQTRSSVIPTSSTAAPTREKGRRSLWKKLALFGVVVAFLVLVYTSMEPNSSGSFGN